MKRKVMYDYKLLTSVAFVYEHWNLVKDRFVRYCDAIEDVSHLTGKQPSLRTEKPSRRDV